MDISTFNYIEASLWIFISSVIAFYAFRNSSKSSYFKIAVVASITFFVFGISDLIEVQTGAWWNPNSLLVLKGICIVVLFSCFIRYIKTKFKNIRREYSNQ